MDHITRLATVTLLGICLLSGCGQSVSSDPSASASGGAAQATTNIDPATSPPAIAASDFVDAVLKGDSQRASARLTPEAVQRIIASGKQFSPPGWKTATFRVSQVRTPSQDQAVVQCVLTDSAIGNSANSEEMCCLLRRVESDWRVCGIAYGTSADQPWTLNDFETGRTTAIPRQPSMPGPASPARGRPSPPRTAQEPSTPAVR